MTRSAPAAKECFRRLQPWCPKPALRDERQFPRHAPRLRVDLQHFLHRPGHRTAFRKTLADHFVNSRKRFSPARRLPPRFRPPRSTCRRPNADLLHSYASRSKEISHVGGKNSHRRACSNRSSHRRLGTLRIGKGVLDGMRMSVAAICASTLPSCIRYGVHCGLRWITTPTWRA